MAKTEIVANNDKQTDRQPKRQSAGGGNRQWKWCACDSCVLRTQT